MPMPFDFLSDVVKILNEWTKIWSNTFYVAMNLFINLSTFIFGKTNESFSISQQEMLLKMTCDVRHPKVLCVVQK